MDLFSWILVAMVAMCVIMATGVIFDSKTWDNDERGGLFVFHHKWVSFLCVPMLFLVPLCAVFYTLFVPLGEPNMILQCIFRALIFIGLIAGALFTFVVFSTINLGLKTLLRKR
jgi:hypothetical protein